MRNALVTPECVALFRRGLELQKIGGHKYDLVTYRTTAAQEEYRAIWHRLHWQLLNLACQVGPLDIAAGEWTDVPDDVIDDGTYRGSVPRARQLYQLLKKGLRK